jgi:hypothetical protein
MKRIFGIILSVFALIALSGGIVLASEELVRVDPENSTACTSFNAEVSGNWGGEYGEGAVTAFPGDTDDAGYCVLTTAEGSKARRLELRVLDGLANDSFEVYVKNPADKYVLVYSYTDQYSTETWVTHEIYGFPAGKGQGNTVDIKIVPTGEHWASFDTFGQLAVDYVAAYEH